MSKITNTATAVATPATVSAVALVALCIAASNSALKATSDKGAALAAAHGLLNTGGMVAVNELHRAAAAAREIAGGKTAPKHVQAGYKLGKRYATVAEFLLKHGNTFAAIGETIGDKATFSVNLCESAMRHDSEDAAAKAYAVTWQATSGNIAARCDAAAAAAAAVVTDAAAAAKAAMRAAIMAEIQAEAAAAAAAAPAAKVAAKGRAKVAA